MAGYTRWCQLADTTGLKPQWEPAIGLELYVHTLDEPDDFDAMDARNVAYHPAYSNVIVELDAMLRAQFAPQAGAHAPSVQN